MEEDDILITFMTCKEHTDIELSIKLQKDSVITTLGGLFKKS